MVIEMPYGHKNAVKVSTNVYLLMVSAVTFMYIRINHWMTYGFMNLPLAYMAEIVAKTNSTHGV